jgi:hypothetical protein
MKLSATEPGSKGHDLRAFTCPNCKRVQVHAIESLLTEAWLEPQHAIKERHKNAVTREMDDGT